MELSNGAFASANDRKRSLSGRPPVGMRDAPTRQAVGYRTDHQRAHPYTMDGALLRNCLCHHRPALSLDFSPDTCEAFRLVNDRGILSHGLDVLFQWPCSDHLRTQKQRRIEAFRALHKHLRQTFEAEPLPSARRYTTIQVFRWSKCFMSPLAIGATEWPNRKRERCSQTRLHVTTNAKHSHR